MVLVPAKYVSLLNSRNSTVSEDFNNFLDHQNSNEYYKSRETLIL